MTIPINISREQLVRLTIDDCLRMMQIGVLVEGEPNELLDGLLFWKDRRDSRDRPIREVGVRHSYCVGQLFSKLRRLCEDHDCHVTSQQPVKFSEISLPEPDLTVLRGGLTQADRYPVPSEIVFVVEVAAASLQMDREDKLPRYASARIPEYWIVNILANEVEIYRRPDPVTGTYAEQVNIPHDGRVSFVLPDGTAAEVEVAAFIP